MYLLSILDFKTSYEKNDNRSMYSIKKHSSLIDQKWKFIFFMDDLRNRMRFILFLFVDNKKLCMITMIYKFYFILSKLSKYVLNLDLQKYNYILIMFYEFWYISRYESYKYSIPYFFREIVSLYWICIVWYSDHISAS